MIHYLSGRFGLLASVVASLLFPGGAFGIFVTFSEGGDTTAASIQDTVDSFRAALGDPNNLNVAGPLPSGRREINWDGGGSATTISPGTTFDGFLNIRGARFTTPSTDGFVQAPPAALDPLSFGLFSAQRIFSPIGSNITDVSFFIPGTNGSVPATVSGFGAVFTDVNRDDITSRTTLEFFDISNKLIFNFNNGAVPIGDVSKQSLSFLGAAGNADEEIYRVRITTGRTPFDLVAMDDFIYAEPKVLPESGGIVLMILGLSCVLLFYRRSLAVS